jgi:hypothetical protein
VKPTDLIHKTFDSVSAPVRLIDRGYTVVEANRAARSRDGRLGQTVVGGSCFEATHGSDEPCWHSGEAECPVRDAFTTRARTRTLHKHWIEDEFVVVEIVATPVEGDDGEIECVVEEFRDLTELLDLRGGLLPICASCKRIRDSAGRWYRVEEYIRDRTGANFSHSLCPGCLHEQSSG